MKYLKIKKQADFQKLFSKGKRAFTPSFTLIYTPFKENRLGISVGKRHGKAVKRNRIKRLIRESFRSSIENLEKSYSFIVIPKVKEEYSFQEYKRHFKKIFEKEKL